MRTRRTKYTEKELEDNKTKQVGKNRREKIDKGESNEKKVLIKGN